LGGILGSRIVSVFALVLLSSDERSPRSFVYHVWSAIDRLHVLLERFEQYAMALAC
jgi:hypothetical protein